jgi:two-component system cell cycle sensor histidine kinase/response regulator CckA
MESPIVLVLEDNEFAASVIRRTLELAGYKCVEARNTDDALECCRLHGDRVRAFVADLVLPGCRGTDIALQVVAEFPNLAVLFVSGTPLEAWPEIDCRKMTELPAGSASFLAKPFRPQTMIDKLGMLLSGAGLPAERRSPVPQ